MEAEVERSYEPEAVGDSKETVSPRHNRLRQINSQRLLHPAQDLHRFKPDKIPAWRRSGHELSSLTKKLFAVGTF